MYQYATLDPRSSNDEIFAAGGVYGVEVTIPALAARCGLGNLDPQHSGGQADVAACVAALSCELPPDGATLVTVRPDADSVLAIAVLTLRASGAEGWNVAKVAIIGQADSAPSGPWVRDYRPPVEFSQVGAMAMNHRVPLDIRVKALADWLEGKELPGVAPVDYSSVNVRLSSCGRYAVALADGLAGRGACGAGYRLAPIVIAVNEAFSVGGLPAHRKYTVARWNATHIPMDWDGTLTELRDLEPGWGGSDSICGSPQGVGSRLSLEQVTAVVERHL